MNFIRVVLLVFIVSGCTHDERSLPETTTTTQSIKGVFMGGGITAGVGIPIEQTYPRLLTSHFGEKQAIKVVNAGIKGETFEQALERIDWLLQQRFDVFVLSYGWEDVRKKLPIASIEPAARNLISKITQAAPEALVIVLSPPISPQTDVINNALLKISKEFDVQYIINPVDEPFTTSDWMEEKPCLSVSGHEKIAKKLAEVINENFQIE